MSEPMSSGEIEDVLSSIRRLVSEDLRPAPKAPSDKPNAAPEAGGKLLLTPALRIVTAQGGPRPAPAASEPVAPSAVAPPRVAPKPKPEPEPKPEDALVLDGEREFEFVAEDIVGGDDYDPEVDFDAELDEDEDEDEDAAELDGQNTDDEFAVDEAELVESEDWLPEASVDDEAGPGWAKKPPEKRDASPDMTRVVSDIAAAVADSDQEWESETGDMPMSGVTWQAPEWVEEAELADDVAAAEDVIKDIADKAEEAAVAEIMERAAQAKAEVEAKQNAGSAEKKAPEMAAESTAKPDIDEDIFAEDEGYFDETVLRDLVRDLIREELSGTLGERITRNVRKLVRAEINRALTARDFD